jgi:hypothetical protein
MPIIQSLATKRVGISIVMLASTLATASPLGSEAQGWPPLGPTAPLPMPPHCIDAEPQFAARMAFIGAKIALKAEQKAEWDAFVAAARAAEKPFWDLCKPPPAPPRPDDTWAVLEARDHIDSLHAERLAAMRAAVNRLKNALGGDQQRWLAEALLASSPHRPRQPPHPGGRPGTGFGFLPPASGAFGPPRLP